MEARVAAAWRTGTSPPHRRGLAEMLALNDEALIQKMRVLLEENRR